MWCFRPGLTCSTHSIWCKIVHSSRNSSLEPATAISSTICTTGNARIWKLPILDWFCSRRMRLWYLSLFIVVRLMLLCTVELHLLHFRTIDSDCGTILFIDFAVFFIQFSLNCSRKALTFNIYSFFSNSICIWRLDIWFLLGRFIMNLFSLFSPDLISYVLRIVRYLRSLLASLCADTLQLEMMFAYLTY